MAWSLASATHSVNNSLLVISGTVELLEMQPQSAGGALTDSLTRIRTQTEAAAETIREVMLFARADLEAQTRVDLRDIITRALAMRSFSARRSGCQLVLLPETPTSLPVHGNPALLLQAVLNLIVNAEQAIANTRGASVKVSSTRNGSSVSVRVVDSGVGVAETDRERIFEPWVTTRDRRHHSGLGLAAVRRIAERHQGSASLEPDGKTFVLSLPLAT